MKKGWLIVSMFGLMITAQAQPRPERIKDPAERAERLTDKLTEALELTEEQQTSVGEINLKYAQEANNLWEEHRESREKAREQVRAMKQQKDAELEEVLTEEQMAKYQEYQEKWKERRGRRRRG